MVCPRTGLAHVSCRVGINGDDAAIHIFKNGVLAIAGASANGGLNTTFAVQGNVSVNAGDTISVRATGDGRLGPANGRATRNRGVRLMAGSYIDDALWGTVIGDGHFNPDGAIYKYWRSLKQADPPQYLGVPVTRRSTPRWASSRASPRAR